MKVFHTYIIFSEKLDRYYTGSTNNLTRRLVDHNRGKTPYARIGMPWKLVYAEKFPDRSSAYQREIEIKKRKSRKYIEQLIAQSGSEHPD